MIQAKRLFDTVYYQNEKYPNDKMFVTKINGQWIPKSNQTFIDEAMIVSRGLIAFGVNKGDNVALVSNNRYEWNVMDIAIQQVGAIVVPLYPNISENDYKYILNDASIKLIVVGNAELSQKIQNIKSEVPSLQHLFSFDSVEGVTNWSAIHERSNETEVETVKERMNLVKNHDLATIIYTSGTTGNPKGVMLSHANIVNNFKNVAMTPANWNKRALSFLPLCHAYERMRVYMYQYLGMSVYY